MGGDRLRPLKGNTFMKTARDKIIASMLEGERVQAELLTNATSEAFSLRCEGWRKSGARVKLRDNGLPSVVALLAVSIAEYQWTKREGESSFNRPLEVFLDNMTKDFDGKDAAILYVGEGVEPVIERAYSVSRLRIIWPYLRDKDSRLSANNNGQLLVHVNAASEGGKLVPFEACSSWDLKDIFRQVKERKSIGEVAKKHARKVRNMAKRVQSEVDFGHYNDSELLVPLASVLERAADTVEECARYPILVSEVEELKDLLHAKEKEMAEFKAKLPRKYRKGF
jgi:hypothetical protein